MAPELGLQIGGQSLLAVDIDGKKFYSERKQRSDELIRGIKVVDEIVASQTSGILVRKLNGNMVLCGRHKQEMGTPYTFNGAGKRVEIDHVLTLVGWTDKNNWQGWRDYSDPKMTGWKTTLTFCKSELIQAQAESISLMKELGMINTNRFEVSEFSLPPLDLYGSSLLQTSIAYGILMPMLDVVRRGRSPNVKQKKTPFST